MSSSPLQSLPSGGRILVIRLRSLGDCVLTTPALEILRRARPDLSVAGAVEPGFAAVFEGNPDIDEILPPTLAAARSWRPHLSLNLHGGTRSLAMTAASGAGLRAGFAHYRAAWAYNVRIPTTQEILGVNRKVHTAEHLASAIFYLGAPQQEIPRAKLFAGASGGGRSYAVIHPMASAPDKTWPAARFLAVAEHLRTHWDLEPVFTAGAGEDMTPFAAHRTLAGAPLADLKNLLAGANLFVGNDSGPAHMAAALGLPVVVLFGPSDPVVWAPWKASGETLVAREGIDRIATADVVRALEKLRVKA